MDNENGADLTYPEDVDSTESGGALVGREDVHGQRRVDLRHSACLNRGIGDRSR